MNHALKASLLSAFACPGAGHLYLKSYPKAATFIVIVIGSMAIILRQALINAQSIIEKIQIEGGTLDINRILTLIESVTQQSHHQLVVIASYSITACWLVALADAYRLGKKMNISPNDIT